MKAVNMDISPELLRQAVTAANDALVIADARLPDKPLVYVNPAFERLTGYRPEEVLGRNCCFLQGTDTQQEGLAAIREALRIGSSCETTVRSYRKDGTPFWNQLTLAPIVNRMGHITHYVCTLSDVTARMQAEQQLLEKHRQLERTKRMLETLALKDSLTGLYNRRHFGEQLDREWNRARREQLPLSLLMIDIDQFKSFNDTYGHLAGDRCLSMVGEAVRRCFARGSDLVARYGGEEFVVLAPGVERRQARERAELLRQAIAELEIDAGPEDGLTNVTVSIGVATVVPGERTLPEDLLVAADRALYQAKRQGRDRVIHAPASRSITHRSVAQAA
jgi:diguanylate cyclase (GGDEF)-like protein/PAS domain S-box-containing protein